MRSTLHDSTLVQTDVEKGWIKWSDKQVDSINHACN